MNQIHPTLISKHLITEIHEVDITHELLKLAKKHTKVFFKYYTWAYNILDNIHIGQRLVIQDVVKSQNLRLFVFITCHYINESTSLKEDSYIEFSDDYTTIIRREKIKKPSKKTDSWKAPKWRKNETF